MREVEVLELKSHWYGTLAFLRRAGYSRSEAEARALTQMNADPSAAGLTGGELRAILGVFEGEAGGA
jgi:hypothetical protein